MPECIVNKMILFATFYYGGLILFLINTKVTGIFTAIITHRLKIYIII